jgi:orotidine-5'-phosphate decarboxylase
VTVLTSMSQRDLDELGVALPLPQQVLHLAGLAQHSGLDGVVCSAEEARAIRERLGDDFLCVTPGIRLATAEADDQQRVMTPEAALQAGSSYLVIGRPVTQAVDPAAALLAIATRIADHGVDAK